MLVGLVSDSRDSGELLLNWIVSSCIGRPREEQVVGN